MAADVVELTRSMSNVEAAAAARSAYARHAENQATPTRRPSRRSRTSQGSHFDLARRRSTRSTTSTTTQKHEPAPVLSTTAPAPIQEAVAPSSARQAALSPLADMPVLHTMGPYLTISPQTQAAKSAGVNTPTPRHFSSTIKGRIKQVFCKATIPGPLLPAAPPPSPDAQPPAVVPGDVLLDDTQAEIDRPAEAEPYTRPYSTSTRSRVTSWTNSTIAAVSSIRSRRPSHSYMPAPEPVLELNSRGLRKRSSFFVSSVRSRTQADPMAEPILEENSRELRKKGSFFGGPVRNRLHRGSKAEPKGSSEESAGLYSALQKRIRPAKVEDPTSKYPISKTDASPPLIAPNLDDTTYFESTLPTIRTITPDPGLCTVDNPSPATGLSSPGSSLKRRSALRVPHASRADAISPSVYSRATDGASLRPLSPEGDEGTTTILITGREVRRYSISPAKPHGAHHRGHGSGSWRKWLSDEMKTSLGNAEPQYQSLSVPSNEEYMHARRTPSPAMQSFMRSNPSPVKQPQPQPIHHRAHGSGSWRKWLSDEMKTTLGTNEQHFRPLNSASTRPRSISPLSDHGDNMARSQSRASSIVSAMNERYPKMVPSRTSLSENFSAQSMRAPSRSSYREMSRPLSRQSYQESVRPPTSHGHRDNIQTTSIHRPLNTYSSKENVRPVTSIGRPPASPLPALSSSQWLATGSHRQRPEVRKTSLKDAVAKPSLSRLSARDSRLSMREPRPGSNKPSLSRQSMMEMRDRSRRSPGQHMVTDWLNERKSRESLVKRAELEDTSIGGSAFL